MKYSVMVNLIIEGENSVQDALAETMMVVRTIASHHTPTDQIDDFLYRDKNILCIVYQSQE